MTTLLEKAEKALADLPEQDQKELVDQLLEAAALRKLKAMIEEGRQSIQRGEVEPFDVEELIAEAHARHGGS